MAKPALAAGKKKITAKVKLQIPAGKANPSPPVGTALGPRGINIMEFCKAFNAQTQGMDPELIFPVEISIYGDRSFSFVTKSPPASNLLKKVLKIKSGSAKPHIEKVGKVNRKQLEEIAKMKQKDLTASDLEAAIRTIAGTARNMGIEIEGVQAKSMKKRKAGGM